MLDRNRISERSKKNSTYEGIEISFVANDKLYLIIMKSSQVISMWERIPMCFCWSSLRYIYYFNFKIFYCNRSITHKFCGNDSIGALKKYLLEASLNYVLLEEKSAAFRRFEEVTYSDLICYLLKLEENN